MRDRIATTLTVLMTFAFGAGPPPGREPARWGTLRGRVVFRGSVPKPAVITDLSDPDLTSREFLTEARKGVPVVSERLVVDRETRGLANAVVSLVEPTAVSETAREAAPRVVNFRVERGAFVPHVLAFQRGAQVVATNDFPVLTNARGEFPGASATYTYLGGAGGEVQTAMSHDSMHFVIAPNEGNPLRRPTVVDLVPDPLAGDNPLSMKVASTTHNWMLSWWFVSEHPYFAVTDDRGRFAIADVPVGAQRVAVWHEAAKAVHGRSRPVLHEIAGGRLRGEGGAGQGRIGPVLREEVEIAGGGPTEATFVVDRRDLVAIDPPRR